MLLTDFQPDCFLFNFEGNAIIEKDLHEPETKSYHD